MSDILETWAAHWRIPEQALADLRGRLHASCVTAAASGPPGSEAAATQEVRLEAAERGVMLWRNNSGALQDETGRWVRYGLCNDSKALNTRFKSADWVGIAPGGRFVAREIKAPGWRYAGTPREEAQRRWLELVNTMGGDGQFATGRGTL